METSKIIVGYLKGSKMVNSEIAICYFERSCGKIIRNGITVDVYNFNDKVYQTELEEFQYVGHFNSLEDCFSEFEMKGQSDNIYTLRFGCGYSFDMDNQEKWIGGIDKGHRFKYVTEAAKKLFELPHAIKDTEENWNMVNKLIADCEKELSSREFIKDIYIKTFNLNEEELH